MTVFEKKTALCLDPSTTCVGWAKVEKTKNGIKLLDSGYYKPKGKTAYARIDDITSWAYLKTFSPIITQIVIEDVTFGHYKSGKIGSIMGALDYALRKALSSIPVIAYSPTEIKQAATSRGNASKAEVVTAVSRLWGLGEIPQEDQADALAIAWLWSNVVEVLQ